MKLFIDGYEVEIKVKANYDTKASKFTTQNFLNDLSILAGEARRSFERSELNALSDWANRVSKDIFDELKKQGVYNN